ncbi:unnamed protein product, partial [Mesorhabditis spiculigera]
MDVFHVNDSFTLHCNLRPLRHATNLRFFLVGLGGATIATTAIICNLIVCYIFLNSRKLRRQNYANPVLLAAFDIVVSFCYLALHSVQVTGYRFEFESLLFIWINYVRIINCLQKTLLVWMVRRKVFVTAGAVAFATIFKGTLFLETTILHLPYCQPLERYIPVWVSVNTHWDAMRFWTRKVFTVLVPFILLIYCNVRIVLELRQRREETREQSLKKRSIRGPLLTTGSIRKHYNEKKGVRVATRTLLLVVGCYLLSNLVSTVVNFWQFFDPVTLESNYHFYLIISDVSTLLTICGCACRLPIYCTSDKRIRKALIRALLRWRHKARPIEVLEKNLEKYSIIVVSNSLRSNLTGHQMMNSQDWITGRPRARDELAMLLQNRRKILVDMTLILGAERGRIAEEDTTVELTLLTDINEDNEPLCPRRPSAFRQILANEYVRHLTTASVQRYDMFPYGQFPMGTPGLNIPIRYMPGMPVLPSVSYQQIAAQQNLMNQFAIHRAQQQAGTPQPMLVPQGMGDAAGAGTASDDAGRVPSPWTEHEHENGRKFYYNKVTKQSSWTRPDAGGGGGQERAASRWKVARTDEGRVYYYHADTKETTWTMPEGFVEPGTSTTPSAPSAAPPSVSPASANQIPMPDTSTPKEEPKEMSEMEKAMAATLGDMGGSIIPEEPPRSRGGASADVPMQDEEQELKKRQANVFRELLRLKYDDGKITSTDSWDHAVKFIGSDPRFRVLQKVSEKKQVFNAWKVQRQKEERDEKRLAAKKAKEELEKWLQDNPKMKTQIRYPRANDVFNKEPIWNAVPDADRREIFSDVLQVVHKREAELADKTRKRNIQALSDILDAMRQITNRTTWAQAQRLLIENPAFADDATLQSMDKEDALIVFEDFIRNAEKAHDAEKEIEDRRFRRQERRVREEFQQFLEELHQKGALHSMSLWSSLYPTISGDPRFDAMLLQSGSTPLDIFKFFVLELKEQYSVHRRLIKDILSDLGKSVKIDTTYDQLVDWVQSDSRGKKIDAGNMKLYFNSLIEKAEQREKEQEREESRKKKRLEGEFRNLLRSLQPPIDAQTGWSAVKTKIEHEDAYKIIDSDELREQYFQDFINQMGDSCAHHHSGKKKKKDKKRDAKSDSESEREEERTKKKKRRDDDEDDTRDRKRKKKSKRHSRSRSRSNSRSDEDRRRRKDSGSD